MPYYITKTGLDAFDNARVWGLAVVLNVITSDEVQIEDTDWTFIVESTSPIPGAVSLLRNIAWGSVFTETEENWQKVFMTAKSGRSTKRDRVRNILQRGINALFTSLQNPANTVVFGTGESLPGGLDPTGFKGLRHITRAQYKEEQLKVLEDHWALACLGMATCGTYRYAREAGQSNWLVLLPIPQRTRFSYFRDVKTLFRLPGLMYHGVQNAAAHYAVQLAERLRRRAAAQGSLQDRYSAVFYFRLMKPDKPTANWKPAQGNQLRLEPLMEAIARDPHETQSMLEWLDYCFRLGSTKGAEELALAATELVMRWDLDAYDRLIRVAVRILGREQIRKKNQRNFDAFLGSITNNSIQKTMEVMSYAVV